MRKISIFLILSYLSSYSSHSQDSYEQKVQNVLKKQILENAEKALRQRPITITSNRCERSAGGIHDFYSEGDYWWQNPEDPNGPYIQRDGMSNPNNFVAHRKSMVRFSQIIGTLASAYKITKQEKYVKAANKHLHAWFIDSTTLMNPHLLYAQAIKGRATGRGIGIIDMIQMMEVAQGVMVMQESIFFNKTDLVSIKNWFAQYLNWVTTHPYGIDEREAKNNHGTCWVMQVAVFAKLTNNQLLLNYCGERFKQVLLPLQMAQDGSFPLELKRTKPYAYSLFNLDAMATIAHVLSDNNENLWKFTLPDGRNLKKAIDFMLPYIDNKAKWQFNKDVMYSEAFPVAQPSLLFAYQAFGDEEYFINWQKHNHFPTIEEVIRNLPARNPLIW
jgi:hypothetical protein